jgi:hypothetical protein
MLQAAAINGGDYLNVSALEVILKYFPFSGWDSSRNLGWPTLIFIRYYPFGIIPVLFYKLTGNQLLAERIFWWLPFVFSGLIFSVGLSKIVNKSFAYLSGLIYITNSYILMIIGGGQIDGIGLAYAVVPLIYLLQFKFFRNINQTVSKTGLTGQSILSGGVYWLLVLLDIRIFFVSIAGISFYLLYLIIINRFSQNKIIRTGLFQLLTMIFPFAGHIFWIIPLLIFRINPVNQFSSAYTSIDSLKFFSFADFVHSISLLHPNWPENIFGKTYFMQPEFLAIPILAYSSLLFINRKKTEHGDTEKNRIILFFALLGLTGSFLAKGVNPPFGGIYLWCFEHLPGFVMFRDPTKWYLLVSLSYSVLIPFSLENISCWLRGKLSTVNKYKDMDKYAGLVICVIFVCFWIISIREAVTGQLGGTFKEHRIPTEYSKLENLLSHDPEYYRTFWVPSVQRFGYTSNIHPAIDAMGITGESSASGVINWLNTEGSPEQLRRWNVRYVIVPDDSLGELFLTDRKYDNQIYLSSVKNIRKIFWLRELPGWSKLKVYELDNYQDKFWISGSSDSGQINFVMNNPANYAVKLPALNHPIELNFSEAYDRYWIGRAGKYIIRSQNTADKLNSFLIPANTPEIIIEYEPQRSVNIGLAVSGISIGGCTALYIYLRKKSKV